MGPKTPPPASLPRAVVLSCRWVCLPGDVWQFLETLLVVIMERGWCCYWHFAGETELLLNIPQRPGRPPQQGTTQPKLSLVPLRATLAQRDGGKLWFTCFSRKCKIYTSTFFIFFFYTNRLSISPNNLQPAFSTQQCLGYFSILRCTVYLIILKCWRVFSWLIIP